MNELSILTAQGVAIYKLERPYTVYGVEYPYVIKCSKGTFHYCEYLSAAKEKQAELISKGEL